MEKFSGSRKDDVRLQEGNKRKRIERTSMIIYEGTVFYRRPVKPEEIENDPEMANQETVYSVEIFYATNQNRVVISVESFLNQNDEKTEIEIEYDKLVFTHPKDLCDYLIQNVDYDSLIERHHFYKERIDLEDHVDRYREAIGKSECGCQSFIEKIEGGRKRHKLMLCAVHTHLEKDEINASTKLT